MFFCLLFAYVLHVFLPTLPLFCLRFPCGVPALCLRFACLTSARWPLVSPLHCEVLGNLLTTQYPEKVSSNPPKASMDVGISQTRLLFRKGALPVFIHFVLARRLARPALREPAGRSIGTYVLSCATLR